MVISRNLCEKCLEFMEIEIRDKEHFFNCPTCEKKADQYEEFRDGI